MCLWFQQKYMSWRFEENPEIEIIEDLSPMFKKEKSMSKLLEKINYGNPNETSLETSNVLTYELGDLVKNLFYSKIYPERKKFHMIEARTAMTDLLAQCQIICDREGWNFKGLHKMGVERAIERIDRRMELRE